MPSSIPGKLWSEVNVESLCYSSRYFLGSSFLFLLLLPAYAVDCSYKGKCEGHVVTLATQAVEVLARYGVFTWYQNATFV